MQYSTPPLAQQGPTLQTNQARTPTSPVMPPLPNLPTNIPMHHLQLPPLQLNLPNLPHYNNQQQQQQYPKATAYASSMNSLPLHTNSTEPSASYHSGALNSGGYITNPMGPNPMNAVTASLHQNNSMINNRRDSESMMSPQFSGVSYSSVSHILTILTH